MTRRQFLIDYRDHREAAVVHIFAGGATSGLALAAGWHGEWSLVAVEAGIAAIALVAARWHWRRGIPS